MYTCTDMSVGASLVEVTTAGQRNPEMKTGPNAQLPTSAWNSKTHPALFKQNSQPSYIDIAITFAKIFFFLVSFSLEATQG